MFMTKDGITLEVTNDRQATFFESLGYRPVEQPVEVADESESVEAERPKRTPTKRAKKDEQPPVDNPD